jgi:hypothetical protein
MSSRTTLLRNVRGKQGSSLLFLFWQNSCCSLAVPLGTVVMRFRGRWSGNKRDNTSIDTFQ